MIILYLTLKSVKNSGNVIDKNQPRTYSCIYGKRFQIKHVAIFGIVMVALGFSVVSAGIPYFVSVLDIPAASATASENGGVGGSGEGGNGGDEEPSSVGSPSAPEMRPAVGDGIPDVDGEDVCPDEPTNTCNEIPEIPPIQTPTAGLPSTEPSLASGSDNQTAPAPMPPTSFQNPRLVPPTIPLAAGSDDNNGVPPLPPLPPPPPALSSVPPTLPSSSSSSSFSTRSDQPLSSQTSNMCSGTTLCGTLKFLTNHKSTSSASVDTSRISIMDIDIQRNNQSLGSFTLNNSETTKATTFLLEPGKYEVIANPVAGSTVSSISADCSGFINEGEIKTCILTIL